jgi:hypothetical protein
VNNPNFFALVDAIVQSSPQGKVMVSIATDKRIGRNQAVNLVTSVYAKKDPKAFDRWGAAGLRMWIASAP